MIEMTSVEIMQQMRVREAVHVPVQINAKKVSFRLCQHELSETRTSLQDALKCINEVVMAVENGEAKFWKSYTWSSKKKEFSPVKK